MPSNTPIRILFSLVALAVSALSPDSGAVVCAQERSYQDMRAEIGSLFAEERYAEAAEILEEALDLYPDHVLATAFNLALMRLRLGDPDRSIEALEAGLDRGVWFGDYTFLPEEWAPVKEAEGWRAFEARNAKAKAGDQALVEPRLEIQLPPGYDPSRRYPFFIALHGGGENLEYFMPRWTSPLLTRDFIVAYPQSSQMVAMDGYSWTVDMEVSLREIRAVYEEVVRNHAVDTEKVVVGGFSSGAIAALEVVIRNALPVQGFVVLCPAIPEGFTSEAVAAARDRGIRGTLLTTEMDPRVEEQQRMAGIMEDVGLPHQFFVTPDVGHWYPDDLGERIDQAVGHLRARLPSHDMGEGRRLSHQLAGRIF